MTNADFERFAERFCDLADGAYEARLGVTIQTIIATEPEFLVPDPGLPLTSDRRR